MKRPTRIAIPLAVLGSAAVATAALAASIPIYTNSMSSSGARSDIVRMGEGSCQRGAGDRALRVRVGERTRECELRTPVIGSNIDITATARLLAGTPSGIQRKVFVAVGVRTGNDGGYELAVFPRRGTYQLRRDVPPDGERSLLANGKSGRIKAVGKPNKLRLLAFPAEGGGTRVAAYVNGRSVASVVEEAHAASTVSGRFSSIAVGSNKAARGAMASFDDLRVSVPDPF
jgi:hypothetical protein